MNTISASRGRVWCSWNFAKFRQHLSKSVRKATNPTKLNILLKSLVKNQRTSDQILLTFWNWSGAKGCDSCRSWNYWKNNDNFCMQTSPSIQPRTGPPSLGKVSKRWNTHRILFALKKVFRGRKDYNLILESHWKNVPARARMIVMWNCSRLWGNRFGL